MTSKPVLVTIFSLLFLPASCACGYLANQEQGQGFERSLWWENLMWIGALTLMLLWARKMKHVFAEPVAAEAEQGEAP